uniref:Protein-tyrosine-phosphatase n=1 Tax=Caenorhabditis japonica TaxID=281687 RepID=A0A8R1DIJ6_CAEJA
MEFLKSMKKRKSKDTKETKNKKKEDKSGSRKKKKKDGPPIPKSLRSTKKGKGKKGGKKTDNTKSESEIFDPNTFTFKFDTNLMPEAENHSSAQTAAFDGFAHSVVSAGVEGLVKEYYDQLATFAPPGFFDRTIFDQNTPLKKNRYKDVVCNDKTRVVLHDGRPGDYIHANYVKGTKYILTQGPLKETLTDFWRMVVQEEAAGICMLCDLVENGKPKCEPYFPESSGQSLTFGDITVTCDEASQPDTHTHIKTFSVLDKKTSKTMKVNHYKIVTWPDKTVALSNLCILRTHRLLRKLPGISIVHCSAGVGRTGTFAAIEIGIQCMLNGKPIKPAELVKALRHCRLLSVQMDTQYLMLAEAIIDCAISFKYIDDEKLFPLIEAFKKQVAEYVEAHPPPVEKPIAAAATTPAAPAAANEKPATQDEVQTPAPIVAPPTPTGGTPVGAGTPRQASVPRNNRKTSREKDKKEAASPPRPPVVRQPVPQSPRGSKERAYQPEKTPEKVVEKVAEKVVEKVVEKVAPVATPPAPKNQPTTVGLVKSQYLE